MPRQRPAGADMFEDRFRQTRFPQFADAVAKRADARKHDLCRRRQHVRITGEHGGLADLLERFLHAPQIGHSIIDDGNCRFHGPFPSCGSLRPRSEPNKYIRKNVAPAQRVKKPNTNHF